MPASITVLPITSSIVTALAQRSSNKTIRARTAFSGRFASQLSKQCAHLVERAQHRVLEPFASLPPDLDAAQPGLGRPVRSALGVIDDDRVRCVGSSVGEDGAVVRGAGLPNVDEVAAVQAIEELERPKRVQIANEVRVLITRR